MKISKNIKVSGTRTSLKLEEELWIGLKEIADSRYMKINDIVSEINGQRGECSLTEAVRVYIFTAQRRAVGAMLAQDLSDGQNGKRIASDSSLNLRRELEVANKKIQKMESEIRELTELAGFYKAKYESRHLRMANDIMEVIKRHSNFISRSNDLTKLLGVVDRENDRE